MKTLLAIALLALSSLCHAETAINYDFDTGRYTVIDITRNPYTGNVDSTSKTLGGPYGSDYFEGYFYSPPARIDINKYDNIHKWWER